MIEPTAKLHEELFNLATNPKINYIEQWSIDWGQYSENDIADSFNYWVLESISNNNGKCQLSNVKNGKVFEFSSNYNLIPNRFYLIYSQDKKYEIQWAQEISQRHVNLVNLLLSQLYNLWYNGNLPLKDEVISTTNKRKLSSKGKMQEKLFENKGYFTSEKWPLSGSYEWIKKQKTPLVLKF